mmetsp:Transcript_38764/g.91529  ORF Transcript_38764/g.91529 Transcript_38764/m.91529 type:complete len:244 (-) Transcript_38764:7-738(-)
MQGSGARAVRAGGGLDDWIGSLAAIGEQRLGGTTRTVEVGGALPALLLVHFHGAEQHAPEAAADEGDGGEGIFEDVFVEEGRGLVRREHLQSVLALLEIFTPLDDRCMAPVALRPVAPVTPRLPRLLSACRVHGKVRRHARSLHTVGRRLVLLGMRLAQDLQRCLAVFANLGLPVLCPHASRKVLLPEGLLQSSTPMCCPQPRSRTRQHRRRHQRGEHHRAAHSHRSSAEEERLLDPDDGAKI